MLTLPKVMKREIITTKDGSKTIHLSDWQENYHSHHGAVQEALHVFIKSGLDKKARENSSVSILEVGFGTGLNAILTYAHALKGDLHIRYEGVEAYPVELDEINKLAYAKLKEVARYSEVYHEMHSSEWEQRVSITPEFELLKRKVMLAEYTPEAGVFDLVYFDAFGPRVQPELWEASIFEMLYNAMRPGAILVTYCAKGQVRRDLIAVGFYVEKIPGPPGKREMLRATK